MRTARAVHYSPGTVSVAVHKDSQLLHIALPEGQPGITSGFAYRPETAKPLRALAEVLRRDLAWS